MDKQSKRDAISWLIDQCALCETLLIRITNLVLLVWTLIKILQTS